MNEASDNREIDALWTTGQVGTGGECKGEWKWPNREGKNFRHELPFSQFCPNAGATEHLVCEAFKTELNSVLSREKKCHSRW